LDHGIILGKAHLNELKRPATIKGEVVKISKNSVVSVHYTLKNQNNDVIDSSREGSPLVYIHGTGSMIPGFEMALNDKSQGEKLEFSVAPEYGYGEWDKSLVQSVAKNQFPDAAKIQVGAQFQAESDHGPLVVTVKEVKENEIVIDGNHPLAGETLYFQVEVMELRAASADELQHGHVHGAGCRH
jgi:FKBP-type peptidyl-prolyl cis-trans isomerase SlyD